jgi:hypothetical protein
MSVCRQFCIRRMRSRSSPQASQISVTFGLHTAFAHIQSHHPLLLIVEPQGRLRLRRLRGFLARPLITACYRTGFSVNDLTASPFCGGLAREKFSLFSPSLRVMVTGLDSCHVPTVKGIAMMISDSAPLAETMTC